MYKDNTVFSAFLMLNKKKLTLIRNHFKYLVMTPVTQLGVIKFQITQCD